MFCVVRVAVLSLLLACCSAATVTYSGYLVDVLCYDKCDVSQPGCNDCALDFRNVITNPEQHTVHCLRDIKVCYESGFIIAENIGTAASPNFRPKYKLDSTGNDNAFVIVSTTGTAAGLAVTATGDDDGSGVLRGATMVECTVGCVTVCTNCAYLTGTIGPVDYNLVLTHAVLLISSWCFLAPMAIVFKRNPTTLACLDLSRKVAGYPLAFLLHGIFMGTAVLFTFIGVMIALIGFDRRATDEHISLGVSVFAIAVFQPVPALFCRPEHDSPKRIYFKILHIVGGVTACVLGIVNVWLGIDNFKTLWNKCEGPSFTIAMFALLGVVAVLAVVLEVLKCCKGSPQPETVPAPETEMESDPEQAARKEDKDQIGVTDKA